MEEIQNLSKKIDFKNLICYFKNKSTPKIFLGFKDLLKFCENIKECNITLEKAKEKPKRFK